MATKGNIDPKLKYEVAKMPGGENIRYCFQCGKCTATCPINRVDENYSPARIVRETLLGFRDVLSSNLIWLCATCYSCTERCPQGVKLADVIRAIRNLAIKEGHIHPFFKLQGGTIVDFGRIFDNEDFINEMRKELGLPPLSPVNRDAVAKILQKTKVKSLLKSEKDEK